jgi:hypothetical protein
MVALRRTLPTLPLKGAIGKSIHGETDRLAGMNAADVGFIDRNPNLHAREVLGDQEQAGRVEAGNDCFTDGDPAVNDHAFDRGSDGAIIQRALDFVERGLGLDGRGQGLLEGGFVQGDVGLGDFVIGFVRIVGGGRQRLGRPEFLRPVPIRLGLVNLAFICSRSAAARTSPALS